MQSIWPLECLDYHFISHVFETYALRPTFPPNFLMLLFQVCFDGHMLFIFRYAQEYKLTLRKIQRLRPIYPRNFVLRFSYMSTSWVIKWGHAYASDFLSEFVRCHFNNGMCLFSFIKTLIPQNHETLRQKALAFVEFRVTGIMYNPEESAPKNGNLLYCSVTQGL